MALTAMLLAPIPTPCGDVSRLPVGRVVMTQFVARQPLLVCINPLPGPAGRKFQWDFGDDGNIDATTTQPGLTVLSPPPDFVLALSYPTASGTSKVVLAPSQHRGPDPAPAGQRATLVERVRAEVVAKASNVKNAFSVGTGPVFFADPGDPGFRTGSGCSRLVIAATSYEEANCHNPAVTGVAVHMAGGDDTGQAQMTTGLGDARSIPVKLYGGGGNDKLVASGDRLGADATLDGGRGNDKIRFLDAAGVADGGPGDDSVAAKSYPRQVQTIVGGPGDDRLSATGTGGTQHMDGGSGDDSIRIRGGGHDSAKCGAGVDFVAIDSADSLAPDCEIVARTVFQDHMWFSLRHGLAALRAGHSAFHSPPPRSDENGTLRYTLTVGGKTMATATAHASTSTPKPLLSVRMSRVPRHAHGVLKVSWQGEAGDHWSYAAPVYVG